jgi:hypothetical protein
MLGARTRHASSPLCNIVQAFVRRVEKTSVEIRHYVEE